jgi:uncharacterized repeat protein (TIGR01451 family)
MNNATHLRHTLICAALTAVIAALSPPAQARQIGKDGALTVSAANTVVNTTTTLTAAATAGATTITVASTAGITAGDVLMVYQAQGATISTTNANTYGAVTALNSAGRYEFVSVASVAGTTITLGTVCDSTPLQFSYANGAQVVRVPQYSSLTVNAGASIVPNAWNGSTGGVVAVIVDGTATINGSINANALGFRGGAIDNVTTAAGTDVTAFVATTTADGAEKGESIAGSQATYDGLGGRYNRGAPANGGGGGNAHNAGGGGGANGGSAIGWNGQGVPDTSVAGWVTAWNLDGTLTATTNSPGGGRGGYTYGASNQDALTVAPGTASWGGNSRRERGGLGGRPLANNPGIAGDTRLFFGGGGGAGDGNNGAASAGARGGGLVYVIANAVAGSGNLQANGGTATNTVPGHNDAPGGGGGGGYIASPAGTGTVTGGANGTTSSGAVTEFLPNGATRGNSGNSATAPAIGSVPICNFVGAANLAITKTNTPLSGPSDQPADTVVSGATTAYTVVVTNGGPNSVTGAVVSDTPSAGLTCPPANAVTCTSPAAGACPAGPLTVANLTAGIALGTLPATAGSNTVTFTFSCTVQ